MSTDKTVYYMEKETLGYSSKDNSLAGSGLVLVLLAAAAVVAGVVIAASNNNDNTPNSP